MAVRAIGMSRARRVLLVLGVVLVSLGAVTTVQEDRSVGPFAFDFNVNWTAAQRLVDRAPLYDAAASRAEAVRELGPRMRVFYDSPFSSYIGPPVTALVHTPLLLLGHDDALALFRVLVLVGMVAALATTACALRRGRRLAAFLVGGGGLLLFAGTLRTLQLGQAHEVVMLALALGIWGTARRRWGVAGVGLGVATVLKLSPVLLVLYLALHRKWRAVGWAAGTAAALSVVAAALGRPGDLVVWLRDVAPSVSEGTRHMYNQSLPAWLARVLTPGTDVVHHSSLGGWHLVGIAIGLGGTLALWHWRRDRPVAPLDLGVVVLLALLAGPLTWDHYTVWALLPLVLLADADRWARASPRGATGLLALVGLGVALLHVTVDLRWATSFTPDAAAQLTGAPYTLGLLLLLAAATALLGLDRPAQQPLEPDPGSTRYTAASSLTPSS